MGGVPSVLLLLWCRGGCSTATVAAALTFFPPNPPCYTLKKKDESAELELVIDETLESTVSTDGVEIALVRSEKEKSWRKTSEKSRRDANPDDRETERKKKGQRGNVIPLALYRNANARYTLVYSHGNATDIGAMHDRYVGIAEAVGVNVLAYDYTGYGAATGSPTEEQTYRDIEAVCRWARENILNDGEDASGKKKSHGLILYGQSVGSGPTCYLATDQTKGNIAGIVLHSPILSGMRVLTESRALSCLDIYPNVNRIARVQCPVMVMHGMRDEEVPWEHGKGMYEAVPEKYRRTSWWVPDRGHNDICEGRRHLREFYQRLKAFVQSLDEETATPAGASVASVPVINPAPRDAPVSADRPNAKVSGRRSPTKKNSATAPSMTCRSSAQIPPERNSTTAPGVIDRSSARSPTKRNSATAPGVVCRSSPGSASSRSTECRHLDGGEGVDKNSG